MKKPFFKNHTYIWPSIAGHARVEQQVSSHGLLYTLSVYVGILRTWGRVLKYITLVHVCC